MYIYVHKMRTHANFSSKVLLLMQIMFRTMEGQRVMRMKVQTERLGSQTLKYLVSFSL